MARSRRGFALQELLPGGISPSTSSKDAKGMAPSSAYTPPVASQAAPAAVNKNAIDPVLQANPLSMDAKASPIFGAPSAAPTPTKFGSLQTALGGIGLSAGKSLGGSPSMSAGSLLGADALGTDWGKLFGYQGIGAELISAALKNLGISKPTPMLGVTPAQSYGEDWLKSMGLA